MFLHLAIVSKVLATIMQLNQLLFPLILLGLIVGSGGQLVNLQILGNKSQVSTEPHLPIDGTQDKPMVDQIKSFLIGENNQEHNNNTEQLTSTTMNSNAHDSTTTEQAKIASENNTHVALKPVSLGGADQDKVALDQPTSLKVGHADRAQDKNIDDKHKSMKMVKNGLDFQNKTFININLKRKRLNLHLPLKSKVNTGSRLKQQFGSTINIWNNTPGMVFLDEMLPRANEDIKITNLTGWNPVLSNIDSNPDQPQFISDPAYPKVVEHPSQPQFKTDYFLSAREIKEHIKQPAQPKFKSEPAHPKVVEHPLQPQFKSDPAHPKVVEHPLQPQFKIDSNLFVGEIEKHLNERSLKLKI